jgi:hypothetical protein
MIKSSKISKNLLLINIKAKCSTLDIPDAKSSPSRHIHLVVLLNIREVLGSKAIYRIVIKCARFTYTHSFCKYLRQLSIWFVDAAFSTFFTKYNTRSLKTSKRIRQLEPGGSDVSTSHTRTIVSVKSFFVFVKHKVCDCNSK